MFKIVGGWGLGLAVSAVVVMNFEDIRSSLGLRLEAADFGMAQTETKPEPEVRTVVKYIERPEQEAERPANSIRRSQPRDQGPLFTTSVRLRRDSSGHFNAEANINGRGIDVLVDTGATVVALTYEDAQRVGLRVGQADFTQWTNTANGRARFAPVMLDEVRIGNVSVRNVRAAVSEPGRLSTTLLGMSFLGQLRMEMQAGQLVLEQN